MQFSTGEELCLAERYVQETPTPASLSVLGVVISTLSYITLQLLLETWMKPSGHHF